MKFFFVVSLFVLLYLIFFFNKNVDNNFNNNDFFQISEEKKGGSVKVDIGDQKVDISTNDQKNNYNKWFLFVGGGAILFGFLLILISDLIDRVLKQRWFFSDFIFVVGYFFNYPFIFIFSFLNFYPFKDYCQFVNSRFHSALVL